MHVYRNAVLEAVGESGESGKRGGKEGKRREEMWDTDDVWSREGEGVVARGWCSYSRVMGTYMH